MFFIGSKKKFFSKYVEKSEYNKVADKVLCLQTKLDICEDSNDYLRTKLAEVYSSNHYFRYTIGDVVYDVVFKGDDGKFSTNADASKSTTSKIKKIVVTDKNIVYVNNRISQNEMFESKESAQKFIDNLPE